MRHPQIPPADRGTVHAMGDDPALGPDYESFRIELGTDEEGPLSAVVIHRRNPREPSPSPRPPLLLMHGWSDYIFDAELHAHLHAAGHDVWGLDLRKYGRSLQPWQTPTAIDHLNRYDDEIAAALRLIRDASAHVDPRPVLLAHSLGGLVATLYAHRHPGAVRALALNSPWLEMHGGSLVRLAAAPLVSRIEHARGSHAALPRGNDHYARSSHTSYGGQFDYDLTWKPAGGHPFPANTLAAVFDGQRRLAQAGPMLTPILVLSSDRSHLRIRFDSDARRTDTVLDVRAIHERARTLGDHVQVEVIPGARHDVFLSEPDARSRALEVLTAWLHTL